MATFQSLQANPFLFECIILIGKEWKLRSIKEGVRSTMEGMRSIMGGIRSKIGGTQDQYPQLQINTFSRLL